MSNTMSTLHRATRVFSTLVMSFVQSTHINLSSSTTPKCEFLSLTGAGGLSSSMGPYLLFLLTRRGRRVQNFVLEVVWYTNQGRSAVSGGR